VLNRVKSTDYARATTVVFTQEYPITLYYGWNRPNVKAQC